MDIRDLRQKAETGSCVAQSVLGSCYLDGIDVEVDYQEAFRLLTEAAKQGASRAVVNWARMHAEGLGIQRDVPKAVELYETVSKVEFLACVQLGRIYSRGAGITPDSDEALKWYRAATKFKNVQDCEELREAMGFVAGRE